MTRISYVALLPVAVLSLAGSIAVGGQEPPGSPRPSATSTSPSALEAYDEPATIMSGSGAASAATRPVAATSGAAGGEIPMVALAAYQRAATVIGAADVACGLRWPLLAAIGKVESGHGRIGASSLDAGGRAVPGILGPVLDGTAGTRRIADTDAGRLDEDPRLDRAVGPMQLLPTTWGQVGVDADGDGVRDPQDIDDAALAAAVYLCSGPSDLTTATGQREAVLRYNRSETYVTLVLAIAESYQDEPLGLAAASRSPAGEVGVSAIGSVADGEPINSNSRTLDTWMRRTGAAPGGVAGSAGADGKPKAEPSGTTGETADGGQENDAETPPSSIPTASPTPEQGSTEPVGEPTEEPSEGPEPTEPSTDPSSSAPSEPDPTPTEDASADPTAGG